MNRKSFVAGVLSLLLVFGVLFLCSCCPKCQSGQGNKQIASQFVHEIMEGKNLGPLVNQYCSPDIQVEFPESFAMPHHGDHHIIGAKEFMHAVGAWQKETSHQVDIVEVIGEGNKVAILARVDRVFKMDGKEKVYKGHMFTYFLEFKDGKVIKITQVFDALGDVEQHKAGKYKGHKCRQ